MAIALTPAVGVEGSGKKNLPKTLAPGPMHGMGAVLEDAGCTFRGWAPLADEVYVVSNFATPPCDVLIPLQRDSDAGGSHDYWSVWVAGVADRHECKFVLRRENKEPLRRVDPCCRDATGRPFDVKTGSVARTTESSLTQLSTGSAHVPDAGGGVIRAAKRTQGVCRPRDGASRDNACERRRR